MEFLQEKSVLKTPVDIIALKSTHKLHQENHIADKKSSIPQLLNKFNLKESYINNRRYLGNKYALSEFIRDTIEKNCEEINVVADIFSGTGAVSNIFKDKTLITNDLLYSNYLSNFAWFFSMEYSESKLIEIISEYNSIETEENNYMRRNFANTFFSASDCSKIGFIREDIELKFQQKKINFKEYSILITVLLYGMDKIANTVGHYDAYIQNTKFKKKLVLNIIFPEKELNRNNQCYNEDANNLIKRISCDLLYLDPPYNSRQYCDAYHLLENVAKWQKPEVVGIAKKMNRSNLKSTYCTVNATKAFEDLINNTNAKYILLSYNNMSNKGNNRSNAKISDSDILKILSKKGTVSIFEKDYKNFSTGKSNIKENKERLFLCKTFNKNNLISCPFNYTGSKYKILPQLNKLFPKFNSMIDLFAGGGNVSINSLAKKIIINDKNKKIIELLKFIKKNNITDILKKINSIIKEYGLSNTKLHSYAYYDCNSNKGLSVYNKIPFNNLRSKYNEQLKLGINDCVMLYVLIVFSFNNQIRFNKNNEFNLPVGKRDFNLKMEQKLIAFSENIKKKDITFISKDFRKINLKQIPIETFIYCDPPYLITTATYNENNGWSQKDEQDLLNFLDIANDLGFRFALSNVLISKNSINEILKRWVEKKKYNCYFLEKEYANSNYHRKNKDSKVQEVLITNYK